MYVVVVMQMLPVEFIVETVIRNWTSCKVGHYHILGFLFMSGFEISFPDLPIGRGGKKNCHRDVWILFCVFSSCGFGPVQ